MNYLDHYEDGDQWLAEQDVSMFGADQRQMSVTVRPKPAFALG